jgi:hypothetical protein
LNLKVSINLLWSLCSWVALWQESLALSHQLTSSLHGLAPVIASWKDIVSLYVLELLNVTVAIVDMFCKQPLPSFSRSLHYSVTPISLVIVLFLWNKTKYNLAKLLDQPHNTCQAVLANSFTGRRELFKELFCLIINNNLS